MRRSNHKTEAEKAARESLFIHQVTQVLLCKNQPNMKMLTASITIEESALRIEIIIQFNPRMIRICEIHLEAGGSNPTLKRQKTLDQKQISTSSRKWISTLLIEPSRSKFKSTWKQQSDIRTGAVMHQKTNFDLITWINIDAIQQNAADHRIDWSTMYRTFDVPNVAWTCCCYVAETFRAVYITTEFKF